MLYMTSRDSQDAYTANRALTENIAPDGGLYIPFSMPNLEQLSLEEGFCATAAYILNQFFSTRLNAWDIEFCVGRSPIKLTGVGRKVLVAETWHNPGLSYAYAVSSINARMSNDPKSPVSSWTAIAIGVAYIFGIYAQLSRSETDHNDVFDICTTDGNFTLPVAALYAKQLGLPIGKIIISSGNNSAVWDLVNHGQMGTSLLLPVQKLAMERLICIALGHEYVPAYRAACERHGVFSVPEEKLDILPQTLFGTVVGKERAGSIVSNVYKSFGYKLSEETAACYGGIQDYRAKTGQGRTVVIFGASKPE